MATPGTARSRVVVVGAGSAGAVVAARLSERADVAVTLLEAGADLRGGDAMPAAIAGPSFFAALAEPGRTWPDLMATRSAGQSPRQYLRGRGIGGSSTVNAMVAIPGHPDDYDEWERIHGCAGWGWRDVSRWFVSTALVMRRAPRREWGPVNRALAEVIPAASEGVPLTRSRAGRRISVVDVYLEPARERPNLTVRADSLVERVLFDGRRATGVLLADGEEVPADLVVVSAGAIHSPALLLRSGVDTPGVGDNLHDHPALPVGLVLQTAAPPGSLATATLARMSSGFEPDDLQLLPVDAPDPATPDFGMLFVALMRTRSRGTVRLAAADPILDPIVAFDMLSDDLDWERFRRGVDLVQNVCEHESMTAIGEAIPVAAEPESIRAALGDYVHAAGTCAMGTVVDERCHLKGYEGVVVCDASVMPNAPRANTHFPTVMIAERVASMLEP